MASASKNNAGASNASVHGARDEHRQGHQQQRADRADDRDLQRSLRHAAFLPVVAHAASDVHPQAAEREQQRGKRAPGSTWRPMVHALEKCGDPGQQAIGNHPLAHHA